MHINLLIAMLLGETAIILVAHYAALSEYAHIILRNTTLSPSDFSCAALLVVNSILIAVIYIVDVRTDKDGLLSYWNFSNIDDKTPSVQLGILGRFFGSIVSITFAVLTLGANYGLSNLSNFQYSIVVAILAIACIGLFLVLFAANQFEAIDVNKQGMMQVNVIKARSRAWGSIVICLYASLFIITMVLMSVVPDVGLAFGAATFGFALAYYFSNSKFSFEIVKYDSPLLDSYYVLREKELGYGRDEADPHAVIALCRNKGKFAGGARMIPKASMREGRLPFESDALDVKSIDDFSIKGNNYCEIGGLVVSPRYRGILVDKQRDVMDGLYELLYSSARNRGDIRYMFLIAQRLLARFYGMTKFKDGYRWTKYKRYPIRPKVPRSGDDGTMTLFYVDLEDEDVRNHLDRHFGARTRRDLSIN